MNYTPDWHKVERMVGLPDYAVLFCVSPWPDGGWMAGVVVVDPDWLDEQIKNNNIVKAMENVPVDVDFPNWDIIDGFPSGTNAHGGDAADAIDRLWAMVHGSINPPWRYECE